MRIMWWLAVGWLLLASSIRADWKITTASTINGAHEEVCTRYYKGKLHRVDSELNPGHPLVFVTDTDHKQFTEWLPTEKLYAKTIPRASLNPLVQQQPEPSFRPVWTYESDTVNTGERAMLLGRPARHLITSQKHWVEAESGGDRKLDGETVTDGWYVDCASLPSELAAGGTYAILSGGQSPIVRAHHSGATVSGLAVQERVSMQYFGARAGRKFESTSEVTELFEGVLPPELFEPPANYKRVDQLPNGVFTRQPGLGDELENYWNSFENWLRSWFA